MVGENFVKFYYFYQKILDNETKQSDDKPEENFMEKIAHYFADKLHLTSTTDEDEEDGGHVLRTVDIQGVVEAWKKGSFKKVVTMVMIKIIN